MNLEDLYHQLKGAYGRQGWWPADTPFEVMVGAVLTQNTAWINVERAIDNLRTAGSLDASAICALPHEELAGLLRPSGYFNVKAERLRSFCQWYLEQGERDRLKYRSTPRLRRELLAVRGIGPETADDILLYAFARPVFVIDSYTRRLLQRLGLAQGGEPYEVLREYFETELDPHVGLYKEYHALIVHHAKQACRVKPRCMDCCLQRECAFSGARVAS